MARPRGEVREALLVLFRAVGVAGITVQQLYEELIASQAAVTRLLVRRTVENMVRAGEVEAVGSVKPAGSQHWAQIYALKACEADSDSLTAVMRTFPAQQLVEA